MPKRHGNLWKRFIGRDNVELATKKALRRRRNRDEVKEFLSCEEEKKKAILDMLEQGNYPPHNYKKRTIYERKKRDLFITSFYPWRLIHHMLINILEEIFVPSFIKHTYGCIKGRGQHLGSLRCTKLLRRYKYVLKCDIRKFYPSINQDILFEVIKRKIKDKKLLRVIKEVVYSHNAGIPIGNLPSQLFGNIYMSLLDHYVKHTLRCKAYVRYVDDFLFFSDSKEELNTILKEIKTFLKEEMKLSLSKFSLFKVSQGVDFLGYRHFQKYKLLRKKTACRVKRVLSKLYNYYKSKKISFQRTLSVIASYNGLLKYCNSYNLQRATNISGVLQRVTKEECNKKGTAAVIGAPTNISTLYNKEVVINAVSFNKNFISMQLISDKVKKVISTSKVLRSQLSQVPSFPVVATVKKHGCHSYLE